MSHPVVRRFVLSAELMAIAHFMRTSSYAIMDILLLKGVSRATRGKLLAFNSCWLVSRMCGYCKLGSSLVSLTGYL